MVTVLPQLWRHALRSASNGARVTVRSSPTPNVHRGERRYHVKSTPCALLNPYTTPENMNTCISCYVMPLCYMGTRINLNLYFFLTEWTKKSNKSCR